MPDLRVIQGGGGPPPAPGAPGGPGVALSYDIAITPQGLIMLRMSIPVEVIAVNADQAQVLVDSLVMAIAAARAGG